MKAKTTKTWAVAAIAVIGVFVFLFSKSVAIESAYPFQRFSYGRGVGGGVD